MSGGHFLRSTPFAPSHRRGYELVEQAERIVLANPQAPFDIAALAQTLAVSERCLRNAFHRIHGLPPYRRLLSLKFSRARKALLSARSRSASVTDIAVRFGFTQLGRFSVDYRKMFGERPAETMRRAVREQKLMAERKGLAALTQA